MKIAHKISQSQECQRSWFLSWPYIARIQNDRKLVKLNWFLDSKETPSCFKDIYDILTTLSS